jgi:hypothetical protein
MPRFCLLLLALGLVLGCACRAGRHERAARAIGQQLVEYLAGHPTSTLEELFTPASDIFVQGAPISMSRERFKDYVAVLSTGRQRYRPVSRVYQTQLGAGWLVELAPAEGSRGAEAPAAAQAAHPLWVEVTVQDQQISRLWMHFMANDLDRFGVPPDVYAADAAKHGMPVPPAWSDGVEALTAAAERQDPEGAVVTRTITGELAMRLMVISAALAGLLAAYACVARRQLAPSAPPRVVRANGMLDHLSRKWGPVNSDGRASDYPLVPVQTHGTLRNTPLDEEVG